MNKSETIGKLSLALSKLQGEISDVHKDQKGYGYMYANLSSVLDICRPLCAKYELAVAQLCCNSIDQLSINPAIVGVETVLTHSSGEWISSAFFMPATAGKGMSSAQAAGSVITYARRYALAAILGITQVDNDAAIEKTIESPKINEKYITLCGLIAEHNLDSKINEWCKHFKVISLDELSDSDMQKLINKIGESNNG